MAIYRRILRVPIKHGEPIIANCSEWLNQNYPDRDPDHQISISFPAYSQDNRECVAIVYCKNDDIIKHLILDFKLDPVTSNKEADTLIAGWKRDSTFKFEDLTSKSTTKKPIDNTTFEEITECCIGCKYNPDGKSRPIINRKKVDISRNEKILRDVKIEKSEGEIAFVIEHIDDTKISYILYDTRIFEEPAINAARELLCKWGNNKMKIAELYTRESRNFDTFVYEIIALAKFLSELPVNARFLLEQYDPESLLHNRVVAQLLYEYQLAGCSIIAKRPNKKQQDNDFDACSIRCEVKTLRTQGFSIQHPLRGVTLTSVCQIRLQRAIEAAINNAKIQIGKGMIFLAPLSSNINAVIRSYFKDKLSIVPPPPTKDTTVFMLDSSELFGAYYIAFPTDHVIPEIRRMLGEVDCLGIPVSIGSRSGLSFRLTTAAKAGSSIGRVDKPN